MRQRSHPKSTRLVTLGLGVWAALTIAACDTGDGKHLQPVDPDTTSTSTVPAAGVGTAVVDSGGLPSVPLDGAANTALDDAAADAFELFTPWVDGEPLDERYTCDGDDISPPLSWTSPPAGTVQLAFAMVDESTLDDGAPFVHWVLAGVETSEISVLEDTVPFGAVQATNSFGTIGWSGPCPPEGEPLHTYRVTMYALNQQVELADGTPASELLDFIDLVAIASVDVTATYER